MKKNKVKFLILIVFVFLFLKTCQNYSYILELKAHWNINVPIANRIIYTADSGPSFHGDGVRYTILHFKNTKKIEKMFEWKKSISDSDIKNFKNDLESINVIDNEMIVDFNNPENLYYIIVGDDQMSTIHLIYNKSEKRLYYLEHIV